MERFMPSLAGDEELRKLLGRTERASTSPGDCGGTHAHEPRHIPGLGVKIPGPTR
jgi:hypothetical protein